MAALGHQQLSQVSQNPGQLGSHPLAAEREHRGYAIVLVVSKQPLKCTKYYNPPDTKVMVRVSSSFFPDHNDVKLTGKSRRGVHKAGYVLWKIDDMSAICILSMR